MEKIIVKEGTINGVHFQGWVFEDRTWWIAVLQMNDGEVPTLYERTAGTFDEAKEYILDTWRELEEKHGKPDRP